MSGLLQDLIATYNQAGLSNEAAFKRLAAKLNEKAADRAQRKQPAKKLKTKSSSRASKKDSADVPMADKISQAYYHPGTYALLGVRVQDLEYIKFAETIDLCLENKGDANTQDKLRHVSESHLKEEINYYMAADVSEIEPVMALARASALKLKQRAQSCGDLQRQALRELADFFDEQAAEIQAELAAWGKSEPTADEKEYDQATAIKILAELAAGGKSGPTADEEEGVPAMAIEIFAELAAGGKSGPPVDEKEYKRAIAILAELAVGAKSGPTADEKATETKNMLN